MSTSPAGVAPWTIERPIMTQSWRDLAYVHWPVEPDLVASLIPRGLTPHTFEGRAWVGLVPFHMVDIAAPRTPPIPWLGTFPETNIRTYVVGPEGPGVWFHSLDITRLLPVVVAQATYRLPYAWSRMSIERHGDLRIYESRRRWPAPRGTTSRLRLRIGPRIAEPSPFEHFLSARWGLYTSLGRRLAFARITHEPWPLHRATVHGLVDELHSAAGYPGPDGDVHAMWSPGVDVRVATPEVVG
ncbi:MAG: DUF2071 domain-containing protein [Acidimicrobiia bacterium]|nr:DUF2071 domain-containing protein [Acidimicrobiia bacterium]